LKPVYDTQIMFSMTQTGGRLPTQGVYYNYPFAETLHYGAVSVFQLPDGQNTLQSFSQEQLLFCSPVKRERENSGRITLKGGKSYVIVCSTEKAGKRGEFFLSVYFNHRFRDMEVKRVFHPLDKNTKNDQVLPFFIPEEAEKLTNQTPLWKIKLVKESLQFMMTDEDTGAGADGFE
jgi:hypothetical protein